MRRKRIDEQIKMIEDFKKVEVADLNLSVRTYKALVRAGYETLADVCIALQKDSNILITIRCIGTTPCKNSYGSIVCCVWKHWWSCSTSQIFLTTVQQERNFFYENDVHVDGFA